MTTILLDTHAWAWSISNSDRLSARAQDAIDQADTILVSPISFYEIAQKVRLGKWPEMSRLVPDLPTLLRDQGGALAELGSETCIEAGTMEWSHRDPFDRLLAATALRHAAPLVSADTAFDAIIQRVW